jgi:hypothetical protein
MISYILVDELQLRFGMPRAYPPWLRLAKHSPQPFPRSHHELLVFGLCRTVETRTLNVRLDYFPKKRLATRD